MDLLKLKRAISAVSGYGGREEFVKLEEYGSDLKWMYSQAYVASPDAFRESMTTNAQQLYESMLHIELETKRKTKKVVASFGECKIDLITAVDDLIKFVERNNLGEKFPRR